MKVSKKLLSMVLCGFITFQGVQSLSLIKADAAFQEPRKWQVPIRLKLRARHNYFYKGWVQIDLYCTKDGILQLQKSENIPCNMTFDDNIVIGLNDMRYKGETQYPFYVYANEGNADQRLAKEINDFNKEGYRVNSPIFMHGTGWDGTLTLPSKMYLHQNTNHNYANGYKGKDKWASGFWTRWDGLHEVRFMHSSNIYPNMTPEERWG